MTKRNEEEKLFANNDEMILRKRWKIGRSDSARSLIYIYMCVSSLQNSSAA